MDTCKRCCACQKDFVIDDSAINCLKCKRWFCCECYLECNDEKRGEYDQSAGNGYMIVNSCDNCEYGDDADNRYDETHDLEWNLNH
jgi:hypothetical protein